MQKFVKFFFISFSIIFFSTYSFANNKTAYIDLDLILSESNPSKFIFLQLKDIEEQKLKKLKSDELKLKEEEKKILSSKNIISNEEYIKIVNNFKKKIDKFNNKKNNDIENLKKIRNAEIIRFFKLVNPIIEKIMEENSIEILFEKKNIFIAKSNYDITQIVIENINKNIKNFKIQE